ncbi:MAG: hypothetical protein HY234_02950 [Acidobacteria bacterium]|nr:hypothetical protein [Acidobacteriota bacterium]
MSPQRPLNILPSLLCATLSLAGAAFAQSPAPQNAPSRQPASPPNAQRDPKIEEWKPSTLPADALAFGAALEESAPPKVKKWSESYAKKTMPKQSIDPRATMTVVDQQFPRDSDEARDAVTFLLFYLAYKEEDNGQRQLAARIRRMDDEAYDITRRMEIIRGNEQNLLASTRRTISQQEMIRNDDEMQQLDQRLRSMSEDRKVKVAQLETLRKRVDAYLKVMGVTHSRMTGIAPTVLRSMQ